MFEHVEDLGEVSGVPGGSWGVPGSPWGNLGVPWESPGGHPGAPGALWAEMTPQKGHAGPWGEQVPPMLQPGLPRILLPINIYIYIYMCIYMVTPHTTVAPM